MASQMEELLWTISGQLKAMEPTMDALKRRAEGDGERLTRLEERHSAADRNGSEEHKLMRERLQEGDGLLDDLIAKSAEHSGEIRRIQAALLEASAKKWSVVEIVLGAIIPLLISGAVSLLSWALVAQKMAAMKGGAP